MDFAKYIVMYEFKATFPEDILSTTQNWHQIYTFLPMMAL